MNAPMRPPGGGDGEDFLAVLKKLLSEWNAITTRAEEADARRVRFLRHFYILTAINAVVFGLNAGVQLAVIAWRWTHG